MTTQELRQALLASAAQGVVVPTEQQLEAAITSTPNGTPFKDVIAQAADEAAKQPQADEDGETETETEATDTAIVRRTIRLNGKQFGPKRLAKLERTLDSTSLPLVLMALGQILADRSTLMAATPGLKRTAGKWDRAAKDLLSFAQKSSVKVLG